MIDRAATASPHRKMSDAHASAPRRLLTAGRSTLASETATPALRALPVGRGRGSDALAVSSDRSPAGRTPHNLPHALSSFVGREQEIAEARRLLTTTRLLTLTGTGGVGKTRLGQEVAAGLLDAFPDGVLLVELAALADAALVPQAVAAVLGVREEADRSLTVTLADAIRAEQLLLVLDNCEHLIEACAALADALLRACPSLKILATSRQPLDIRGETTLRVASLAISMPPDSSMPSASAAGRGHGLVVPAPPTSRQSEDPIDLQTQPEAVRLFVERARAVVPAFTLTNRNVTAVEQICQRLDGIPLAIELASARIAVLSPEQIAGRLDDRFGLLSCASRTALPRYRTLRALVDWSHDLLDERERVLFRRLAVFAGGWTLEAAESVCADDALAPGEILDLLAELVAKSLVLTVEHGDEVRYRFLETLRAYATEKLRDAGEETQLRDRHSAWHLTLAEQAAPELNGPRQEVWLDRLDRERENLRVAQRWAVTQGDAETMARLGAALWQFWWARADAADAREWINTIVPLARQVQPTRALAEALHGAGMLAGSLAEYVTCRSLLREALVAARQIDDRYTLASVLDSLGRQLSFEGHYAEAYQHLNESLSILRQLDNRQALARALSRFGFLKYLEGDHESARLTLEEGLAVAREVRDPAMVAEICDKLGQMFQSDGDLDGAVCAFQQAEAIWREIRQGHWLAMTMNNLGNSQTLRGELDIARIQLAEALGLSQRMGNRRRMAFTIASVATLAALEGDPERALRLDAVSSGAVAEMGIRRVPPKVPLGAQQLERARQTLGATASAAVIAAARMMTLAQAAEETLAWLTAPKRSAQVGTHQVGTQAVWDDQPRPPRSIPVSPAPAAATLRRSLPAGLSPRELEVLCLLASGRTCKEVADDLVLSTRTVERHITHIYEKIGARGRADATAFALKHGLI